MFFFFSKALFSLTQPLFWLLALLLWAYRTRSQERRKTLLKIAFWSILLASNPLILNTVCRAWESAPTSIDSIKDTFDVCVVLGGFSNMAVLKNDSRLQLGVAANRLTDALYLYKKGKVKKILISGGSDELVGEQRSEAVQAKDFILAMGVRDADLILEDRSRNTHENALFTRQKLRSVSPFPSILLITSAFHMKRAVACFKKEEIPVYTFPAHFMGAYFQWTPRMIIKPDDDFLWKWQFLIKEWIGCVVYKIRGYI